MNEFILHGGLQNWSKYNCSALTSDEWTKKDGVRHEIEGIVTTVFGIIVEVMYIPCLFVLARREFQMYSCFKIMLVLGFIDMGAIAINSIVTGVLLYQGAVFCTYPNFIYITGSIALWFWCSSCMLCLLLVVNRLFDLVRPHLGAQIFEGNKTYLIIIFPILYGMYFFFFTNTLMFHSKYRAWFFDPMTEPGQTDRYNNYPHYGNNIFVVGFTMVLYAYFIIFLGKKLRAELTTGSASVRAHKQIFLQSAIICTFTFFASVIYVTMQIIDVPLWVIKFGHVMWEIVHSCPAFIYLFVNRTIRQAVIAQLRLKAIRKPFQSSSRSSLEPVVQLPKSASSGKRQSNQIKDVI